MWTHIFLVFLFLWEIGFSITINDCPNELDKDQYLTVYGGKCYYFYRNIQRVYDDAQDICQEKGGNLASVKTSELNNFIWSSIKKTYSQGNVWIGLSDQKDEGYYQWRDGSEMGYDNFESGTGPSRSWHDLTYLSQDCVGIKASNGKWIDLKCGHSYDTKRPEAFLCEYTPKPSPEDKARPQATKEDCPSTVTRNEYLQTLDHTCYYFYLDRKQEFTTAQTQCKNLGGNLASIKTQRIEHFIWKALKLTYKFNGVIWIGLRYLDNDGVFVWVDGSKVTYENFGSGEGSRGSDPYVALDTFNGKWQGYSNGRHEHFICEFPATTRTTTTNAFNTFSTSTPIITTSTTAFFTTKPRPQVTNEDCPSTVARDEYLQTLDHTCYYFYLDRKQEFTTAQTQCKNLGGNLASIKTQRIEHFIWKALKSTYRFNGVIWIGLRYLDNDGVFVWVDGSKVGYENFGSGEGSEGSDPYVAMDTFNGKWQGYSNGRHEHFICEFPATTRTTQKYTSPPFTSTPTTTTTSFTTPTTSSTTTTTTITTSAPLTTTIPHTTTNQAQTTFPLTTITQSNSKTPLPIATLYPNVTTTAAANSTTKATTTTTPANSSNATTITFTTTTTETRTSRTSTSIPPNTSTTITSTPSSPTNTSIPPNTSTPAISTQSSSTSTPIPPNTSTPAISTQSSSTSTPIPPNTSTPAMSTQSSSTSTSIPPSTSSPITSTPSSPTNTSIPPNSSTPAISTQSSSTSTPIPPNTSTPAMSTQSSSTSTPIPPNTSTPAISTQPSSTSTSIPPNTSTQSTPTTETTVAATTIKGNTTNEKSTGIPSTSSQSSPPTTPPTNPPTTPPTNPPTTPPTTPHAMDRTTCATLVCEKDCGLDGYQQNPSNGCMICKCALK